MALFARLLLTKGEEARAIELALQALQKAAPGSVAAMYAREVLTQNVPDWHAAVVRDTIRNDAYDAALRLVIKPGMRVLDIGAGTGLLSMMAARAGAGAVYTCEMNRAVASAATDVIRANGFADRITVFPVHSSSLDVERDLGGPVDVIVSEIVSNHMLGEGVLPTMDDAVSRFLKPGGHLIPASGSVRVALGFDDRLARRNFTKAQGFDVSLFNRLSPLSYVADSMYPLLAVRSTAADLLAFDFTKPVPAANRAVEVEMTGGPGKRGRAVDSASPGG